MTKILLILFTFSLGIFLYAWEEDPRIADHNEKTDYLLKLGNKQAEEEDETTVSLLAYAFNQKTKLIEKADNEEEED